MLDPATGQLADQESTGVDGPGIDAHRHDRRQVVVYKLRTEAINLHGDRS